MGQMNGKENVAGMGQSEAQLSSPLKQSYSSGMFAPAQPQQQPQQPPQRASRAGLSHSVSVANLPKDNRNSVKCALFHIALFFLKYLTSNF